jgi:hypothetical protein
MARISKFATWVDKQMASLIPLFERSTDAMDGSLLWIYAARLIFAETSAEYKKMGTIFKRFPLPGDSV